MSRRGISSRTCLSCPAENIVFSVCASKMALIFLHHGGPRKHLSGPLGQPATLQLPQPITVKPQGHPGSEAFHHYAQILRLLGNIPKTFFCAIETPAWKIPAASISLSQAVTPNCSARFCVTKGISPANLTFEWTGESACCVQGNHAPSACACPELSNQISCMCEYKYCCPDPR